MERAPVPVSRTARFGVEAQHQSDHENDERQQCAVGEKPKRAAATLAVAAGDADEVLLEVGGEERILGPGGLFHVESTTPRRIANAGEDELVLLVVGGKGGYVERDGHVMSDEDLELRMNLGKEQS